MAELTYSCQNLSNYHVVVYWSKLSATLVARELSALGLSRYPQDFREWQDVKNMTLIEDIYFMLKFSEK